jgi:ABC-type uncharacterized transport system ATPase subunit
MASSPTHKITFPLIALRGITKRFPNVLANDAIDLDIHGGEVHALLGENGAGKSTLMKILYGFYRMDSGQILMNGKPVQIRSPHNARALHIGMVFQDMTLIPAFTVTENIALFLPDLKVFFSPRQISERIKTYSDRYGLKVSAHALISQLSIGEQQKVEILKLLLSDARVLILDEPTRVLAPHEIESLFTILERLKQDGFAIVLITHKLKEVLACADHISILRGGKLISSIARSQASEEVLVRLMFEKDLGQHMMRKTGKAAKQPVLQLRSIRTQGEGAATSLQDLDLEVCPGEIVGVAGVSGNGQRELGDVILGMERIKAGARFLDGKDFTHRSIGASRRSGLGFIPENPLSMATVPFMTVLQNMALTRTWKYSKFGGLALDWKKIEEDTHAALERFGFTFSLYMPVKTLSGGNLQRLIIAREMAQAPRLIVASYLTRGLDVHSTIVARQALLQARNDGAGVVLISEDLEELFALSDRLIVLFEGRIVGEFPPAQTNVFEIGHLMTGSQVRHAVNR